MTILTFESFVFSSAILLALSFPKFNLGWLAYLALVPALSGVKRSKSYRESATLFLLVGFIFALISMEWIRHVTYFGWIYVCFVGIGMYFALFGTLAHFALHQKSRNAPFLLLPAAWVLIEWFRTELPVWGLGWNLLGYSQGEFLPVARLASYAGVYGVSYLIVWVNLSIWFVAESYFAKADFWNAARKVIYSALTVAIVIFHFGQAAKPKTNAKTIAVSVIQGNIPQSEKWDPEFKHQIIETYRKLTELAAPSVPDLVVWPEAAWPGIVNLDPEQKQITDIAKTAKTHLLIGSPFEEVDVSPSLRGAVSNEAISDRQIASASPRSDSRSFPRIFNSAHLLDQNGKFLNRYDKIRLVPFGEFVPFASLFNLFGLERLAYSLGVGDFSSGQEFTVFELKNAVVANKATTAKDAVIARRPKADEAISGRQIASVTTASQPVPRNGSVRFSTLICFEDVFPSLARKFVRHGAEFLIVITNDAWFGKSAAAYQHLQASQFRAIEEGVPVIRAANTGVSAFIDSAGNVFDRVRDSFGHDTWIAGGLTRSISLAPKITIYQRFGYLFPLTCFVLALAGIAFSRP